LYNRKKRVINFLSRIAGKRGGEEQKVSRIESVKGKGAKETRGRRNGTGGAG